VLEQELRIFTEGYSKLIFLCIGNDMRGDDAVGPLIAKNLVKLFLNQEGLLVINAGTVPENYTGIIKKEQPSHIIFIDAVEMKKNPGSIKLIKCEEIANYNISTHAMPLSFMIKYLESFINVKILLIGIQPKNMRLSNQISEEANTGVEKLIKIIKNSFDFQSSSLY
jgi:hydrogenase 3 maturation protease